VLREHRRLAPLAAGRNPLGDLARVKRGDCVVAFARREVLSRAQRMSGCSSTLWPCAHANVA